MYNQQNQTPKFPWFLFLCIAIFTLWSSKYANTTMEKMNAGASNHITFNSSKQIIDTSDINDNDFVEINSIDEIKKLKKQLNKNEYYFIKFDEYIINTRKRAFSNSWVLNTAIGNFICESQPNGFVVFQGLYNNNYKIYARIYAIIQKSGQMYVYKLEKMETNDTEKIILENDIINILLSDFAIFAFFIILIIIPMTFEYCNRHRILFPRFIFFFFFAICCLAIILVLLQFILNIYFHNTFVISTFRFILTRMALLISATFGLLALNDNRHLYLPNKRNILQMLYEHETGGNMYYNSKPLEVSEEILSELKERYNQLISSLDEDNLKDDMESIERNFSEFAANPMLENIGNVDINSMCNSFILTIGKLADKLRQDGKTSEALEMDYKGISFIEKTVEYNKSAPEALKIKYRRILINVCIAVALDLLNMGRWGDSMAYCEKIIKYAPNIPLGNLKNDIFQLADYYDKTKLKWIEKNFGPNGVKVTKEIAKKLRRCR
jgi:hypothetical protein